MPEPMPMPDERLDEVFGLTPLRLVPAQWRAVEQMVRLAYTRGVEDGRRA